MTHPCARHPDRLTGLRCGRCGRPACPECLRDAPVGQQCVDCVVAAGGGRRFTWRRTSAGSALGGRPVVVPILVLVNVVAFVATAVSARSLTNNNDSYLFNLLGLWPPQVAAGAWWQLVSSGFLHYGPIHIAMNMLALWIIGRDLESLLGGVRFTAVYLLSLVGGGVAVFLFGNPNTQVAGASGAVFGLMGGVLVAALRFRLNPSSVVGLIVINLALSVAIPGISLLGHLGGLLVGAVTTAGFLYAPARHRTVWHVGTAIAVLGALICLVSLRSASFVA